MSERNETREESSATPVAAEVAPPTALSTATPVATFSRPTISATKRFVSSVHA